MIRTRLTNPALVFLAVVVGSGITGVVLAVLWGIFEVVTHRAAHPSTNLMTFWLEAFTSPLVVIGGVIGLIVAIILSVQEDRLVGWRRRLSRCRYHVRAPRVRATSTRPAPAPPPP